MTPLALRLPAAIVEALADVGIVATFAATAPLTPAELEAVQAVIDTTDRAAEAGLTIADLMFPDGEEREIGAEEVGTITRILDSAGLVPPLWRSDC